MCELLLVICCCCCLSRARNRDNNDWYSILKVFFSFLFYREEAQHLEEIDCLCFWLFGVPLLLVSIPFSSTDQLNTNQKDFFFCLVKNKRNIRKKLFSFFYITAAGQNEVRKNLPLDRNRDLLTTFAAIPQQQQHYGGEKLKENLFAQRRTTCTTNIRRNRMTPAAF